MSLLTQVQVLAQQLRSVEDAASALHTTLSEDRPLGEPPALVDGFEEAALEVISLCQATLGSLAVMLGWLEAGVALRDVKDELVKVHTLLVQLSERSWSQLAAYRPLSQLVLMGSERGPRWRAWSRVVETAVLQCCTSLAVTQPTLIACWAELCERLGPPPAMRATSLSGRVSDWLPPMSEPYDATGGRTTE